MFSDLRLALRQVRHHPGFAAAVVLTLALGVGAVSAVFTLADPMLLRPLPFPDSDRIVQVRVSGGGPTGMLQLPDYFALESGSASFAAVTSFGVLTAGRFDGTNYQGLIYGVSPGFFDVLRTRQALGRLFLSNDHTVRDAAQRSADAAATGSADIALMSHALWQTMFASRSTVIGETIRLGGPRPASFQIVGVLPADFFLPQTVNPPPDLLVPVPHDRARESDARRVTPLIGLLNPGVTPEAASAEVQAVLARVESEFPQFPQGRTPRVTRLQDALFANIETPLLMLFGTTACVLLLACSNLAHLFMARISAREWELATRLAIGASRWRIARQLLSEATVLTIAGGLLSLVVANLAFAAIMAQTPQFAHVYRLVSGDMSGRVLAFTAVLLAVALGFYGAVPAFISSRGLRQPLQQGPGATFSRGGSRQLIGAQCAVAAAVLVTGTLIVGSFVRLTSQPIGFRPDGIRVVSLELPAPAGPPGPVDVERQRTIYEGIRSRLGVPVTLAGGIPAVHLVVRADRPEWTERVGRLSMYPAAGTFFDVFGMKLTRGRLFTEGEAFSDAPIAVIDEKAAALLWPGEDPLGKTIAEISGTSTARRMRTVVGVVATVKMNLTGDEFAGTGYIPFDGRRAGMVIVRSGDRSLSVEALTELVHEVAPGARITINPVLPFERELGQPRFLAVLLSALGVLTMALTIIGIFGVINHESARRTREIGLRMALGAAAADIWCMMSGRVLGPALIGALAGLAIAFVWTPGIASILFGLQPRDPMTFLFAGVLVIVLAVGAGVVPTWRASHISPATALRAE
jgi:predicted permease